MELPQVYLENGFDDLQDSDSNILNLFNIFISPIDQLRSFSRPINNENSDLKFTNLSLNGAFALESRLHAFYRLLGFPVVASVNSFYSPGFNPDLPKNIIEKHKNINDQLFNSELGNFLIERELLFTDLKQIFTKQDLTASLYTLCLKHPRPYIIYSIDANSLATEPQTYNLDIRTEEITKFLQQNFSLTAQADLSAQQLSKTVVGKNYSGGRHPLKPWIVDGRIENTIIPDTSKICAPFLLSKNSTKISSNTYLLRPGIELIIRLRLQNLTQDTQFLTDVEKILNHKTATNTNDEIDFQTLRSTVSALANDNKLTGNVLNFLSGFSQLQTLYTTKLTKLLKNCLQQQILAIQTINSISSKINWLPVPSISGPETGSIGASLARLGTNDSFSDLDNRITELRIKQLQAQRFQFELNNLGNFASPFQNNLVGDKNSIYQNELNKLLNNRDYLTQEGLQAIGIIEMISGEISGLGLIDVLAIYLTLWSIDLSSLLGLIDSESITRLQKDSGLSSVADTFLGQSLSTSFTNFQHTLFNILTFCDKFLLQQLLNPTEIGDF